MAARILNLGDVERKHCGLFAGAVVQVLREGADKEKLKALWMHLVDSASESLLREMVQAGWVDFATTVIECLPGDVKPMVWDHLDKNEGHMCLLKEWLEPELARLRMAWAAIVDKKAS